MISYELAKKLKDAGFPQDGSWSINGTKAQGEFIDDIYIPSLSELIEACGENFFSLINFRHENFTDSFNPETESFGANSTENGIFQTGWTPEEAVANLWLALNPNTLGE